MSLLNMHNAVPVLDEMEQAPFAFHLTGSRFFDCVQPNSDWDFFVENQPDLKKWLVDHRFQLESGSDYNSTDVVEVWVGPPVYIQTVKDAGLKSAVQDGLLSSGWKYWMYRHSKDDQKTIWDFAFNLFRAGEKRAIVEASHHAATW